MCIYTVVPAVCWWRLTRARRDSFLRHVFISRNLFFSFFFWFLIHFFYLKISFHIGVILFVDVRVSVIVGFDSVSSTSILSLKNLEGITKTWYARSTWSTTCCCWFNWNLKQPSVKVKSSANQRELSRHEKGWRNQSSHVTATTDSRSRSGTSYFFLFTAWCVRYIQKSHWLIIIFFPLLHHQNYCWRDHQRGRMCVCKHV